MWYNCHYMSGYNDIDKWISRGGRLLGLFTLFGFLLFFVGRKYVEQYYGIMGISTGE